MISYRQADLLDTLKQSLPEQWIKFNYGPKDLGPDPIPGYRTLIDWGRSFKSFELNNTFDECLQACGFKRVVYTTSGKRLTYQWNQTNQDLIEEDIAHLMANLQGCLEGKGISTEYSMPDDLNSRAYFKLVFKSNDNP